MKPAKPKKCRVCKSEFKQYSSTQIVCSPRCALAHNRAKAAKAYKQETAAMKRAQNENDRSHQLKLAQKEFNGFIRARDFKDGCISCGTFQGKKNAGHYFSVGAYPEKRFMEENVHLQCERCNSYLSGNIAQYRIGLVKKIGGLAVDRLEGYSKTEKLTLDDIKEIKIKYREKRKQLEQLQEAS